MVFLFELVGNCEAGLNLVEHKLLSRYAAAAGPVAGISKVELMDGCSSHKMLTCLLIWFCGSTAKRVIWLWRWWWFGDMVMMAYIYQYPSLILQFRDLSFK